MGGGLGASGGLGQMSGPPTGLGQPLKDSPFGNRDQFGRTGPFQGRSEGGVFNQNTLYGNGSPMGSAGWVATHPDFKAPASGVGSTDWIKTHPNYGNPQGGLGQPNNWFGGGTPLKTDANQPAYGGGGWGNPQAFQQGGGNDIMSALQQMFGGGGGGIGPFRLY